ncbi:hypothetical protein GCM10027442_10570 [Emticicia fontis]
MAYNGKTYDLTQGLWSSEVYDDENIEELSLILATSDLKIKYVNGDFDSADGKITGLVLYIYMKKGTKGLDAGEYTSDINDEGKPNTFYGGVIVNADLSTLDSDDEATIEFGKLTVKKNGSIYEITLDGKDEDGKAVKGFYKGELKSIE